MLPLDEALELIRLEYAETPELQLTFWQAQRLWEFSDDVCAQALSALTRSGFLIRTRDGRYARRDRVRTPVAL